MRLTVGVGTSGPSVSSVSLNQVKPSEATSVPCLMVSPAPFALPGRACWNAGSMRIELTGRQPLLRRDIRACVADEGWLTLDAGRLSFASPLDLAAMVALAHNVPQGTRVGLVVPRDIRTASYLQRMDVLRRLPVGTEIDGRLPEEQRTDCSGTLLEVSPLLPSTVQELVNRVGRLTSEQLMTGVAGLAFRGAGELIDNATSHGHSQLGAFLCAQTYTGATSGRVGFEFAVCDTGIGVLAHLRGNPAYLRVPDSRTAIAWALQRGVSGTTEQRGNGLADLLQFTQEGGVGRLVIRSGHGVVSVAQRGHYRRDAYTAAATGITGTWAWLRVRFP